MKKTKKETARLNVHKILDHSKPLAYLVDFLIALVAGFVVSTFDRFS